MGDEEEEEEEEGPVVADGLEGRFRDDGSGGDDGLSCAVLLVTMGEAAAARGGFRRRLDEEPGEAEQLYLKASSWRRPSKVAGGRARWSRSMTRGLASRGDVWSGGLVWREGGWSLTHWAAGAGPQALGHWQLSRVKPQVYMHRASVHERQVRTPSLGLGTVWRASCSFPPAFPESPRRNLSVW